MPETTGEKKGVGFAEQKPKENDKGAASSEEVCNKSKELFIIIMILIIIACHLFDCG